jgi:hypothetical protein
MEGFGMARRKGNPQNISFVLEQGFTKDIRKWEILRDRVLKYHWDYYNELAYQRSKISDELKRSLLEATDKQYKFDKWQRTLKYKYSLEPLSVLGSILDPVGGRFNIGDIDKSKFQPFPALHIASDRETSLQEVICQKIDHSQLSPLTPLNIALADRSSISHISISGNLETIINLNKPTKLQGFVNLIKDFTVSKPLKHEGKSLGFPEPDIIRTVPKLISVLMATNWREWPMQFDVPVASQIFGQLVSSVGIEGILFKSKFANRKDVGNCLAIYPQNFKDTGSFVVLDDAPPPGTKILKWDSENSGLALQ